MRQTDLVTRVEEGSATQLHFNGRIVYTKLDLSAPEGTVVVRDGYKLTSQKTHTFESGGVYYSYQIID